MGTGASSRRHAMMIAIAAQTAVTPTRRSTGGDQVPVVIGPDLWAAAGAAASARAAVKGG